MPHDRPWTQMGCFVVAEFLLTGASHSLSAIAEFLVISPTIALLYDAMRGSPFDEARQ